MPNAWLNHVRQFRKQNRHLSYKQLLKQAKNTYGGEPMSPTGQPSMTRRGGRGVAHSAAHTVVASSNSNQNQRRGGGETGLDAAMKMLGQKRGGSVQGFESRSSLTRMATRVGGRSRKTRRSRR